MLKPARWAAFVLHKTPGAGAGSPASADVITDWNEKAVAFVTAPDMLPPQAERVIAGPRRHVRRSEFDRAPLPAVPVETPGSQGDLKGGRRGRCRRRVLAQCFHGREMSKTGWRPIWPIPAAPPKKRGSTRRGVAARIAADRRVTAQSARYVPAQGKARRVRADAHHRLLDVAEREAVRDDQPVAIPAAAADRAHSAEWAADYNEIKASAARTARKRPRGRPRMRRFWLITGPASYYPIARQIVAAKKMNVIDSARFMALVYCGRRCLHRGVRRQVSLRVLAPDHGDPQRRHRRQSRNRA